MSYINERCHTDRRCTRTVSSDDNGQETTQTAQLFRTQVGRFGLCENMVRIVAILHGSQIYFRDERIERKVVVLSIYRENKEMIVRIRPAAGFDRCEPSPFQGWGDVEHDSWDEPVQARINEFNHVTIALFLKYVHWYFQICTLHTQ